MTNYKRVHRNRIFFLGMTKVALTNYRIILPRRCRIVGFNARPLVFYVNIGGNVETPPKNIKELPRGHFLGSFLGHKKVPSRDLFRAQKKYPRDLFRAQKSTLGIFLGNKKVP